MLARLPAAVPGSLQAARMTVSPSAISIESASTPSRTRSSSTALGNIESGSLTFKNNHVAAKVIPNNGFIAGLFVAMLIIIAGHGRHSGVITENSRYPTLRLYAAGLREDL